MASLVKLVFPDNQMNQMMAYAMHEVASEWDDGSEEYEEVEYDEE